MSTTSWKWIYNALLKIQRVVQKIGRSRRRYFGDENFVADVQRYSQQEGILEWLEFDDLGYDADFSEDDIVDFCRIWYRVPITLRNERTHLDVEIDMNIFRNERRFVDVHLGIGYDRFLHDIDTGIDARDFRWQTWWARFKRARKHVNVTYTYNADNPADKAFLFKVLDTTLVKNAARGWKAETVRRQQRVYGGMALKRKGLHRNAVTEVLKRIR